MSALKVLERAEQLGLLEPKLVADLRKQVSESKWNLTPEAVVKLLVDRGHLTPYQARTLVSSVNYEGEGGEEDVVELEAVDEPAAAPTKPAPSKAGSKKGSSAKPSHGGASKGGASKEAKREEEVDLESALPSAPATSVPTQVNIRPNQPVNQDYLMAASKPSPDEPDDDTELKLANEPSPAPVATPKPASFKQPGKLPGKKAPLPPPAAEGPVPISSPGLTPVSPPALVPVTAPTVPTAMAANPYPPQMVPMAAGADLVGSAFSGGAMGPTGGYAPVMVQTQPAASIDTWGSVVEPNKGPKKRIEKRVAPSWENPWLLGGAGALIVLMLVLGALVFSLGRTSADKLLDAGNTAYKSGAYSQAIGIYEQFEKNFGSDPNASVARVKKGMASIRQVFDGQRDMTRALTAAQEFLPKIEGEEKFDTARAELETMLPDIADNFATQAETTSDTSRKDKLVKLSEEALRLCDNPAYLPQSRKEAQRPRLERIREQLAVARRKIDQDTDLQKAISVMETFTKSGDTGSAYTARADLLVRYPGLDVDPRMVAATESVSVAERKLVAVDDKPVSTVAPPSFAQGKSTVLASRSGEPLAELQGKTLFVGVNGSTFGLDAATGRLLWRRTMGTTRIPPVYLGAVGSSDAIVANEQDQCVERIEAASGKVLWRCPIGERFFTPILGGTDHLFVTSGSGVIHQIDVVSGESLKRAKLPQKATSSPAYDARRKVLYQAGESGSLFALAGDTLGGRDGLYLGHKAGGVTTPPLVVSGHVVVCENSGRGVVLVHVLNTDKRGYELKKEIEPIAMTGQMVQPAASYGRRVVVLTSSGEALILEIDINNEDTPIENAVREVVRQPAASANTATVGYQLLDGPRLWVADNRLARYEVIASRSALNRGPATWDGDTFVAPLQKIEGNVVTVRRKGGTGATTVQLVRIESDDALWTTDIGSAPQWLGVAGDRLHAITSSGNHFVLPTTDTMPVSVDAPTTRITSTLGAASFSQKASYGKSGVALVDPARGLMLAFDPAAKNGKPIATKMKLGDAKVAGPVGSFADGVLVPLSGGKIMVFDPVKGEPKDAILPLFPEAAPGQVIQWLQPQVYGDEAKRFVAIDSRRQLFLAGLVDRPQAALAEQGRVEGERPFVGSLSLSGDRLYTVQREEDGDTLVVYSMPGITEVAKHKLGGRIGPRGVSTSGGLTFVEIDRGELWAFEKGNDPIWKVPLPAGVLACDPRVVGADVILGHQLGSVVSLDRADGSVKGSTKVGESLSSAVAEAGNAMYFGTLSGAIHRVELPLPAGIEGATR